MQKLIKFAVVLIVGFTIIIAACAFGHCWPELLYFTGTVLAIALIVSVTTNDSKKQREIGYGIVFWSGIIAIVVHAFIYSRHSDRSIVHGSVILSCFIEGIALALLIYYLPTILNTKPESSPQV